MKLKDFKLYFYLAAAALLSWILVEVTDREIIARIGATPEHSPDYFSIGYTKWEMNMDGTEKNKLTADKMTHYNDDGTIHLDNPVMVFLNEKTPPWVIKSESGILSADGKDLQLQGKVSVERAEAPGVRRVIINTSNVKVNPETSYAETKEWAELISPPNRTTGTGMKLVFSEPIHLQLLANVKGKYETK
ncbi:MAG: LPS export ABC transporter periplasmic protein LptC [Gammaproteobacteria bacterium]